MMFATVDVVADIIINTAVREYKGAAAAAASKRIAKEVH